MLYFDEKIVMLDLYFSNS